MDLLLIFLLPLLVAAILGGPVAFPVGEGPHGIPSRTRRQRLGAWLVVVGLLATLGGLWTWVTSVESQSHLLGTVVFLVGSAGAVAGFRLIDRPVRDGGELRMASLLLRVLAPRGHSDPPVPGEGRRHAPHRKLGPTVARE